MMFDTVIFDLDGTLIDSMGIWLDVDKEFLSKRDIIAPENLFEDIKGGNSFVEIANYFKEKFALDEPIEEIMAEWTEMVKYHYENYVKLKIGVREFLSFLKNKNIKMAVGTSNSLYLCKSVLSATDIISYFSVIVAGDDDIKGKPFPDIFLKAAEMLDSKPENCLVIEDTLSGVIAAKKANMKVCAVYDKHSQEKLAEIKENSDWYVKDFIKLNELFKDFI